jgi:hypothetical protein
MRTDALSLLEADPLAYQACQTILDVMTEFEVRAPDNDDAELFGVELIASIAGGLRNRGFVERADLCKALHLAAKPGCQSRGMTAFSWPSNRRTSDQVSRAASRLRIANRRRPTLGGAKKFLLPPSEEDVTQRSAVVYAVNRQAQAVQHGDLLVRELNRDVFEPDRRIDELGVKTLGHNADQSSLAPKGFITGAQMKWGTVYDAYAKLIAKGEKLPNLDEGGYDKELVLSTPFGAGANDASRKAVQGAIEDMKADKSIFVGGVKDNKGNVISAKTVDLYDGSLWGTNYLIEGVVGSIT